MEIGQEISTRVQLLGTSTPAACLVAGRFLHDNLVVIVKRHHATATKVQGEGGGQQGEQANLYHFVVEHLILAGCVSRGITVLELSSDSAVSSSNGNTAGKDTARLKDDGGSVSYTHLTLPTSDLV